MIATSFYGVAYVLPMGSLPYQLMDDFQKNYGMR